MITSRLIKAVEEERKDKTMSIPAESASPETWTPTGSLVIAYRKGRPEQQWLAEVWRCIETGELDYRSLPLVELPETTKAHALKPTMTFSELGKRISAFRSRS